MSPAADPSPSLEQRRRRHAEPLERQTYRPRDWLLDRLARGVIALGLALPYRVRVPLIGWLMQKLFGRLSGYRRRAMAQIAMIFPQMSLRDRQNLAEQALNNAGRVLIENYGSGDLLKRAGAWPVEGPGLEALERAAQAGRPTLLITGHFGNYEAARAALVARGYAPGGLYRPLNNGFANARYVATMQRFGGPVFPRGREGLKGLVKFLKSGGQTVMLIDQFYIRGSFVEFLGKPALTSLAAAELALKYDAEVIPFYGLRAENGLDFRVSLEAPIAHSTPVEMTQALTDSLAAQVRAHPGQWFWVHRRWKLDRVANHPTIGPELRAWEAQRNR